MSEEATATQVNKEQKLREMQAFNFARAVVAVLTPFIPPVALEAAVHELQRELLEKGVSFEKPTETRQ